VRANREHEAMRAALLRITDPPPPAPERDAPSEAPPAFESAPTIPRFAASLGPGVLAGPGGVSANGHAAFGFTWMPIEHLAIDARATLPLISGRVTAPEGTARVGITTVGAGASWVPTLRAAAVRPSIGAGAMLAWVHVDGVAAPPYVSNTDDVLTPMPYAHAGLSIALAGRVRLALDGAIGVTLPETRVSFAGRDVASLGSPLVFASSSIEATW
jgi:hypothetical protein